VVEVRPVDNRVSPIAIGRDLAVLNRFFGRKNGPHALRFVAGGVD